MTWQIYGAEQFIACHNRDVTILTNEIWSKIKDEDSKTQEDTKTPA